MGSSRVEYGVFKVGLILTSVFYNCRNHPVEVKFGDAGKKWQLQEDEIESCPLLKEGRHRTDVVGRCFWQWKHLDILFWLLFFSQWNNKEFTPNELEIESKGIESSRKQTIWNICEESGRVDWQKNWGRFLGGTKDRLAWLCDFSWLVHLKCRLE